MSPDALVAQLDLVTQELQRIHPPTAERVLAYLALSHPVDTLAALATQPNLDASRSGAAWRAPAPCLVRAVEYQPRQVDVVLDFDVVLRTADEPVTRLFLPVPRGAVVEVRVPPGTERLRLFGHWLC